MSEYRQKSRFSRILVLFSYFSLLALYAAWYLKLHPIPSETYWIIAVIQVLPLLAFLPTIIKGRPRGHAWLCFVLMLYFIQAVSYAFHPVTFTVGVAAGVLISMLFGGAMMYARWESRYRKEQNAEQ